MYKKKIYVFIYLSIMLPVLLLAGALERYTVPQQQSGKRAQPDTIVHPGYVSEEVYTEFEEKISGLSSKDKKELKEYYSNKRDNAVKENNMQAANHYIRLINILKKHN